MSVENKSSIGLGKILLIIIVLIMAFIVMQKMGINIVKTTEKSEMTDDPHPEN
jgi:hypothetical protein